MRRAARTDANQTAIVDALRRCGWSVLSLAPMGRGVPDLAASKAGRTVFIEVKDGAKCPSARKLTQQQREFFGNWQGEWYIVESAENALRLLTGSACA